MKKTCIWTLLGMSILFGCSDMEEQVTNAPGIRLQASFEQGAANSRLAVGSDNTLSWTAEDAFVMFDENGAKGNWILEGEGGTSGTFVGAVPEGALKGAAYPSAESTTLNGDQLTMTLSSTLSYDANGKCNLPMWSSFSSLDGNITFKHLGALLKVNFTDIPSGYTSLIVTASNPIAGTFVADLSKSEPVLVALDNATSTVKVNFDAVSGDDDNDRIFFVPLPVGEYASINVSISDGTTTTSIANWKSRTVERKNMYVASLTYKVSEATTPAGVTEELSTLSAEAPVVQVSMTKQIDTSNDASAISIPVVEEASTNVQLNFEEVPATTEEKPLVVEEAQSIGTTSTTTNDLSISIPSTNTTTALTINTPTTTVNLESGKFAKVIATTASNTLIVGDGTIIEDLTVSKGNVKICAGGKITSSITYTGTDAIYLILGPGVTSDDIPSTIKGNITVMRGFDNKELSYALYDRLGAGMVVLDGDGYAMMTQDNIDAVTELDFGWNNYHITSLSGIEYFVNLEYLTCSDSGLAMCDLSQNTKLRNANIQQNQMQSLDFSNCPELETLVCSYNKYLVDLNLTGCTKLGNLQAQSTGLTSLSIPNKNAMYNFLYGDTGLSFDLNEFPNLTGLGVMNHNLASLDFIPTSVKQKLSTLFCDGNQLTSIDLSEFPNLECLYCDNNQLTNLDLAQSSIIRELSCHHNKIASLDVTPLTTLERLQCGNQRDNITLQLTANSAQEATWNSTWVNDECNTNVVVNGNTSGSGSTSGTTITITNTELSTALYGVLGAEMVTLDADGYAVMKKEDVLSLKDLNFRGKGYTITTLSGIEHFVNLEVLHCNSVGLTSCDLSKNTALKHVDFTSNSALTELNLSANENLNYVYLGSCTSLSSLNLTGCTNLKTLVLNSCKGLTSVDIPNKADLLTLNYASTKLSFDLTEYTSLIDLNLGNTGLTSLNIPEAMKTRLQHFGCSSINLETLDLSEYPNLTSLNCTNTGISTLDLTQAPNLEVLECQANNFTVLDITPLTNLQYLYCGHQRNSVILQLKLTDEQKTKWESSWSTNSSNQNVVLYEENKITIENAELSTALLSVLGADKVTLNSSGYAEMKEADVLEVTSLDFGWGEYTITSLNGIENFVNLDYLYCPASGIEEMDLSKNTKLYYVACNNNKLTTLDLSQITNLQELRCQNNGLESLTFNGASLTFLECGGNPDLTSLDLSACTNLRQLHVYGNKMASLDLSKCTSLTNLNCENMGLTSLNVSFCTSLEELNINDNQLASLDLSKNKYLNRLMISNNTGTLSSLDLSSTTGLVTLWCEYSNLTQLIINQCTSLKELYCRDNKLTSLDLSGNAILNHLDVMDNSLTTLDLSNNSKLKKLYCTGNYLTKLDIVPCTTLNTLSSGRQYSSSDRTEYQTMELTLTSLMNERWTSVWSSDDMNSHVSVVVSDSDSQASDNGMTGSNFGNGGSF